MSELEKDEDADVFRVGWGAVWCWCGRDMVDDEGGEKKEGDEDEDEDEFNGVLDSAVRAVVGNVVDVVVAAVVEGVKDVLTDLSKVREWSEKRTKLRTRLERRHAKENEDADVAGSFREHEEASRKNLVGATQSGPWKTMVKTEKKKKKKKKQQQKWLQVQQVQVLVLMLVLGVIQ
ncbi:hypothetical protein BGZ94_006382 [Podila epigama]|nr:hypothetical protein BGZ94_006382 [Podila epigama]